MTTIHLPTLERDIELKTYTRGMARQVNDRMLEGITIVNGTPTNVSPTNVDRSEELAIQLITGLTHEELDRLSINEYEDLRSALNDATSAKKNETMPA